MSILGALGFRLCPAWRGICNACQLHLLWTLVSYEAQKAAVQKEDHTLGPQNWTPQTSVCRRQP